jgi:hypothetical protein
MEVLKRFIRVRRDLQEIVNDFPEDKVEEAVCGNWGLKCVLSHIAGWDAYFTTALRLLRKGEDVPFRGDKIEEWNEAFVKEREGKTWREVRDEFAKTGEDLVKEYTNLTEELRNRRFWPERNPTPAWVVEYSAAHSKEHLEEIRGKLSRLRKNSFGCHCERSEAI